MDVRSSSAANESHSDALIAGNICLQLQKASNAEARVSDAVIVVDYNCVLHLYMKEAVANIFIGVEQLCQVDSEPVCPDLYWKEVLQAVKASIQGSLLRIHLNQAGFRISCAGAHIGG
jgi:hypothetical protein